METWIAENWFVLLQSTGIVGSLLFTGVSLSRATRARRVETWFTITDHHRDLWREVLDRPELARIRDTSPDLSAYPVTDAERRFIQLLIHHLAATHLAIQSGAIDEPSGLRRDIVEFLSRPIPGIVWEESKRFQENRFVRFVESEITWDRVE
jgi:hypothetical protein